MHQLHLEYWQNIDIASARHRANPRFFEKNVDGGSFWQAFLTKRLTQSFQSFQTHICTRFPLTNFKLALISSLFSFPCYKIWLFQIGHLIWKTRCALIWRPKNAKQSRSLMKTSPHRTGFSAPLLGIGSPSRPLLFDLECSSVCTYPSNGPKFPSIKAISAK